MPCDHSRLKTKHGGGVMFVCIRGRQTRPKPCHGCGKPSAFLCDFPITTGRRAGRTCDRPLCGGCRRTQPKIRPITAAIWETETIDFCPDHDREAAAAGQEPPAAPSAPPPPAGRAPKPPKPPTTQLSLFDPPTP